MLSQRLFCVFSHTLLLALLLMAASCGSEDDAGGDIEVGCRLNSDCNSGDICQDGECVEDEEACEGPDCPCINDLDCGTGQACDQGTGECFALECLVASDCVLGQTCELGRCTTDLASDRDRDGVPDAEDTCAEVPNAGQEDNDADGQGDACDTDDDNDSVPDTLDNCPEDFNPRQGDANEDGLGNACDPEIGGTTVVGTVNFAAGGDPDTSEARVFITGREEPALIDSEGNFVFEQVLPEGGAFIVRVRWPGFVPFIEEFEAPATEASFDVGELVLRPDRSGELSGQVVLRDEGNSLGVLVEALVGEVPVSTTLSNEDGAWRFGNLSRIDHVLRFSKERFVGFELDVEFNTVLERFEVEGEPFEFFGAVELEPDRSAAMSGQLASSLEIDDWTALIQVARLVGDGDPELLTVQAGGAFALNETVVPGIYGLEIEVVGHLPVARLVVLEAGANDLGEVELVPEFEVEEEAVEMVGVATLAGREDHSGIEVRAFIGNNFITLDTTDAAGNFSLLTSRSPHTLEVARPGFVTATFDVVFSEARDRFEILGEPLTDSERLELQPDLSASLSGRVVTSIEGLDLSDTAVTLVSNINRRLTVAPDGQFAQDTLAPGLYGLEVVVLGHLPVSRIVQLDSGDNDLGDIVVEPIRVPLVGHVDLVGEDDDGDVTVRLRRDGVLVATTLSDETGRFIFQALPRDYSLSVSKDNFIGREGLPLIFDGVVFRLDGQRLDPDRPIALTRSPQSDADADGVIDALDNCPDVFNVNQRDIDGDETGDVCDADADGDGMFNGFDNCPLSNNPMQEDRDGLGRGVACSGGTLEVPFMVGCGVDRQRVDTRERSSVLQGSCGGAVAPEVVYELDLGEGETWNIQVEATHPLAIYVLDAFGSERVCSLGGRVELSEGDDLPAGSYRLVVDGFFGADASGPMEVAISSTDCGTRHEGTDVDAKWSAAGLPVALVTGDFNGDGEVDIAGANESNDRAGIMLGDGRGNFDALSFKPVGDRPRSIDIGDVDNDGNLDILTANSNSSTVSILLGRGDGTFQDELSRSVGSGARSVVLGDLNEDGLLDVVTANEGANNASVLIGNGDGSFQNRPSFSAGNSPHSVSLGDIDGDGHLDIAVANLNDDDVSLGLGDGQGGFQARGSLRVGTKPFVVKLRDINSDGHLDVVVANNGSADVSVILSDGQGDFLREQTFRSGGGDPVSMVLDDVNGDGHLDIVLATLFTRFLDILLGDGEGGFTTRGYLVPAQSVAVADVNRDGHKDILMGVRRESRAGVLFGEGKSFFFASQKVFGVGVGTNTMNLGDVDKDGHLDVVTTNFESGVVVSLGNGRGDLAFDSEFLTSGGPVSPALGDIDGDGDLDVVFANVLNPLVTVLSGDGRGEFVETQSLNIGSGLRWTALGDVDGDGDLDLAVAVGGTDRVAVSLNDGDGVFGAPSFFAVGDIPNNVVFEDLDGDGNLDIVTANGFDAVLNGGAEDSVTVLMGDGDGGFGARRDFTVGIQPFMLSLGDLDGDGNLDLVTANSGRFRDRALDNVTVLMGDGDGGFGDRRDLPVDDDPKHVEVGDANGDGYLDITVAHSDSRKLGLLLGDGLGGFAPMVVIQTGSGFRSAFLGDLNEDGRTDIVTAIVSSNEVGVLLSKGSLEVGSRRVSASVPSCRARTIEAGPRGFDNVHFFVSEPEQCRVDRLALNLSYGPDARGEVSLSPPSSDPVLLGASPALPAGLWSPEITPKLGVFETQPANGEWLLSANFDLDDAQMLINTYPSDPLAEGTLVEVCSANTDQAPNPDFVCRLPGDVLGASIDGVGDEDAFLLQGLFDGAFLVGQTIEVEVEATPGAGLAVSLRAFRAFEPLALAEEVEPGLWVVSFEVPLEFSGRYFSLHVTGEEGAVYDVRFAP